MQRRLSAILSADTVGYTRLMEIDEVSTLSRLKSLRYDMIDPGIASHSGRIVKLMGDGMLVEFANIADAVSCAIEIQREMAVAKRQETENSRLVYRIGVNLGYIIADGEDIYGDGVNVAARLQSLADPGGVTISGIVREHIGSKLALDFEDFGEHTVKNLERPVRVYMARLGHPRRDTPRRWPASAANRIRIAAQLINGADGRHVWAERYDSDLEDIFALQDEISKHIVDAPGAAPGEGA